MMIVLVNKARISDKYFIIVLILMINAIWFLIVQTDVKRQPDQISRVFIRTNSQLIDVNSRLLNSIAVNPDTGVSQYITEVISNFPVLTNRRHYLRFSQQSPYMSMMDFVWR